MKRIRKKKDTAKWISFCGALILALSSLFSAFKANDCVGLLFYIAMSAIACWLAIYNLRKDEETEQTIEEMKKHIMDYKEPVEGVLTLFHPFSNRDKE